MSRKINLIFMLSAFFLTMCRAYAEPVSTIEGLSCRSYTDSFQGGSGTSKGFECSYTCPDGTTVGPLEFEADPALSFTKGDLDRQYCGIAPEQFTATAPDASTSPTLALSSTPAASPTAAESPTPQASATAEISPTAEAPLLTGRVTMCDLSTNLISFRIAEPPPDLTDKTLTAQIAEQESSCYVNPTNPSLMTCTIPSGVTFPAKVVVQVDGAVASDFTYDGSGCAKLPTALPFPTSD